VIALTTSKALFVKKFALGTHFLSFVDLEKSNKNGIISTESIEIEYSEILLS
jgi:hypothetical protein